MTSLMNPVTTVNHHDDDSSADDDEEEALGLRAFAAELDEIAKALEDDARRLRERSAPASQRRNHGGAAAPSGPAYRTPPPISHHGAGHHERRSRRQEASQRGPGATALGGGLATTPQLQAEDDQEVPTPMQTPAPLMFSPLFDSEYKSRASPSRSRLPSLRRGASNKVSWEDYLVSTPAGEEPVSGASRAERAAMEDAPPAADNDRPPKDTSSTRVLDLMRGTIERQDDRIRSLELENNLLRSQVRDLEADLDRLKLQRSQPTYRRASALHSPSPVHYDSTTTSASRAHPSYSSPAATYRSYQTPPPSYRSPDDAPGTSPGARFVAELSRLVDVDPVYHAPLSRIMDDHFARASEAKRRCAWGGY